MSSKKTIGFLVGGIMDEFTEPLCKGAIEEAAGDDINIVFIPIKYINREMKDIPDLYEFQYQTTVSCIKSNNIDILIVSADNIGCLTTQENLYRFMDDLKALGIPIVLAASKIAGYPGVTFDNKSAIYDGMTYLVDELGLRNICMLTSLEHNADVAERYEAFQEMAEYYKLEIGPNSVVKTPLAFDDCKADCEKLLDLNPDVEAVICINDDNALGLYEVMEERGLVPGKDIMVMGFDNSLTGSMATPSLTTADADAKKLGAKTYTLAKRILDGWNGGELTVPTRFILRDSFGSFMDRKNVDKKILDKQYLDEYFNSIFYKFENNSKPEDFRIFLTYKALMNIIIDYVNDVEYSPERVSFIKTKTDEFFMMGALEYTDVDVLISYVDRVKAAVINRFDSYERKCQVYETFSTILKKVALTLRSDTMEYKLSMKSSMGSLKRLLEETLDFSQGGDENYITILNNLSSLGVNNAYLYMYETPIIHRQDEIFNMPDHVLLKAAMTDGTKSIVPPSAQYIDTKHLFDNSFLTQEQYNMVLMPLYFRETLYGVILFDLNDAAFQNGDFLANQYATVARVINLL